jgi:hypothetical protein
MHTQREWNRPQGSGVSQLRVGLEAAGEEEGSSEWLTQNAERQHFQNTVEMKFRTGNQL